METERQRIIELFQTGETANIKLGISLAKSLKLDFEEFYAQMETIFRYAFGSKAASLAKPKVLEKVMQIFYLSPPPDADLRPLQYLPKLEDLSVGTKIKDLSALRGHRSLKKISCTYLGLEAVPSCIFQLPQIEELSIYGNRLAELPDELGTMTNLRALYARNNRLRTLPDALYRCDQLETLGLSGNEFTEISFDLSRFPRLKKLYLHENQLKFFPESLLGCAELEELILEGNRLTSIPHEILRLPKLFRLRLEKSGLSPQQAEELRQAGIDYPSVRIFY